MPGPLRPRGAPCRDLSLLHPQTAGPLSCPLPPRAGRSPPGGPQRKKEGEEREGTGLEGDYVCEVGSVGWPWPVWQKIQDGVKSEKPHGGLRMLPHWLPRGEPG